MLNDDYSPDSESGEIVSEIIFMYWKVNMSLLL